MIMSMLKPDTGKLLFFALGFFVGPKLLTLVKGLGSN